jgi:hypothetical protein
MAEHEPCTGGSDDWYTPPDYFSAFGCRFDLDPCSPGIWHWVPAHKVYTKADDGLSKPWAGFVFMNPPFGGRFGHVPWLEKFFAHGNGIGIIRSYTSSSWWHDWMPCADIILFPRGKTRFIPSEETRARLDREAKERDPEKGKFNNAPGHGIAIFAAGQKGCDVLAACGLGMIWRPRVDVSTPSGSGK